MLMPEYAENLIVGIRYYNQFAWYVLPKDFCFLDIAKLEDAYRQKGYLVSAGPDYRFGIRLLDRCTARVFLEHIAPNRTTPAALREMLLAEPDPEERLSYVPTILIDFDKKFFRSIYPEYESYEHAVPDSWDGAYGSFEDRIPERFRYWLGPDGKSLIR